MAVRSDLGVWLEQQVRESGLSLNRFAREVGISPASVSKVINGERRSMRDGALKKLAVHAGVDAQVLEVFGLLDAGQSPDGVLAGPPRGVPTIEEAVKAENWPPKMKTWFLQCVEFARAG